MSKQQPSSSKKRPVPEFEPVTCDRAARGVWLVKVPKYLSDIWQKNEGNSIGSLITTQQQQVIFKSNPDLKIEEKPVVPKVLVKAPLNKFAPPEDLKPLGKKPATSFDMPREHNFIIKDLDNQTMAVLMEDKSHLEENADAETGKLTIEGRVVKRAECQPPATTDYMKMKISLIEKASQPTRTVKQMDRAVVKFKPVAQHAENIAREKAKKENPKAVRIDREIVMREIFQAFEKHQYYRIADLQRLTNQPISFIKEILTSIANYNTNQPHKNTWELKPEYRSYGNKAPTTEDPDMFE